MTQRASGQFSEPVQANQTQVTFVILMLNTTPIEKMLRVSGLYSSVLFTGKLSLLSIKPLSLRSFICSALVNGTTELSIYNF